MEDNENNDLTFQEYLIIFYDLIGQREALRKITGIPVSEGEKDQFLEFVRKSVGRVMMLRRAFRSYFDGMASHIPNTDLVAPEFRQEFIESQKAVVHFYGLSDAIVIAVPLMDKNENCTPVNGIFSALTATCGITLLSLSLKIPARAGIDVGVGVQIDDREVYGPALERAVRIESEQAEYPRLIVGRELQAYLNFVERQKYQTRLGGIAADLARRCRQLMVQDTDGRIILDYLGNNIREVFENKIEPEIVLNAWNYINEEHLRLIKEGNEKLASRYFRMIRYFKSRLGSWGIGLNSTAQPTATPDGFATR